MNSNSIIGFHGGTARNEMPSQALATATETALLVNTDSGTSTAFLVVPNQTAVVGSSSALLPDSNRAILGGAYGAAFGPALGQNRPYFASTTFDGRPFRVRLAGSGNAGANAAQSVLLNLYQGTSSTLGSDTLIATTGAALATVAGGGFNFVIEATLVWDSVSQILSGSQTANIAFGTGQQYTVPKAAAAVVSGVTLANLSFLASVKFGNAAASTIQVKDFSIDMI